MRTHKPGGGSGIKIPSGIASKEAITQILEELPKLNEKQIQTFYQEASKIVKQAAEK